MKKRIPLWMPEEYHFPGAGNFIPFLMAKLHKDDQDHPAMMVVPGGGFILLSPGEADGVADKFYEMGYNTFVLVYTNNVTLDKPMIKQAIADALRAVKILRKEHKNYGINANQIYAVGFSAGAFLAACMATLFDSADYIRSDVFKEVSARPDAVIPVYGPFIIGKHAGTKADKRLLGKDASESEVEKHSPHLQLTKNSSPMCIFQGSSDKLVPSQNALLMAWACAEKNVPYELHIFLGCDHGFIYKYDDPAFLESSSQYVFEQLYYTIESMSKEELASYGNLFKELKPGMPYREFIHVVLNVSMTKLWNIGLGLNQEKAKETRKRREGNFRYALHDNPSSDRWWHTVDNWLKLLTRVNK